MGDYTGVLLLENISVVLSLSNVDVPRFHHANVRIHFDFMSYLRVNIDGTEVCVESFIHMIILHSVWWRRRMSPVAPFTNMV